MSMNTSAVNFTNSNYLPNGSATSNSTFSITNNQYLLLNCYISSSIRSSSLIKKVEIRIPYTNTSIYYNALQFFYNDSVIGIPYSKQINGTHYLILDVTAYLFQQDNSIKLKYEYTGSISLYTPNNSIKPYLYVEYIPLFSVLEKDEQFLSFSFGKDSVVTYNLATHILKLKRGIYSGLLDVDISLVYSSLKKDNQYLFFPKGCTLNVLEHLEYSGDHFIYYDHSYHPHYMQIINLDGREVYYDITGTTLILEYTNSVYKLFSPYSKAYKTFDSNYRIISSNDGYGNSLSFSYTSTSVTITDNRGNVVLISKNTSDISIKLNNANETTIAFTNNLITSLTNFNSDSLVDTFSFDSDNRLINYNHCFKENCAFTYSNGFLSTLTKKSGTLSLDELTFLHDYFSTTVTNQKGVQSLYTFDDELNLSSSGEIKGDSMLAKSIAISDALKQKFMFSGGYKLYTNSSCPVFNNGTYSFSFSSNQAGGLTFDVHKQYLLVVGIRRAVKVISHESGVRVGIQIDFGSSSMIKWFKSYSMVNEFIGFPFSFPTNSTSFTVKLIYENNYTNLEGQMYIYAPLAMIFEYQGYSEQLVVGSTSLNSQFFTSPVNSVDKPFYYEDVLCNFMSYNLNLPFFWSNKNRELVQINRSYLYNFNSTTCSLLYGFKKKISSPDVVINNSAEEVYDMRSYTYSSSIFTFQTIRYVGIASITTYKKMNTNFQITEEKDINGNVTRTTYSSSNNPTTMKTSKNNFSNYFYVSNSYDSLNRQTGQSTYIQTSLVSSSLSYSGNYNLVSSITDEENHTESYTYTYLTYNTKIVKSPSTITKNYSNGRSNVIHCGEYYKYKYNTSSYLLKSVSVKYPSTSYQAIESYTYSLSTNDTHTKTYQNGYSVKQIINKYGNLKEIKEGSTVLSKCFYYDERPNNLISNTTQDETNLNSNYQLYKIKDDYADRNYLFDYSSHGISSYEQYKNTSLVLSNAFTYDYLNRAKTNTLTIGTTSLALSIEYQNDFVNEISSYNYTFSSGSSYTSKSSRTKNTHNQINSIITEQNTTYKTVNNISYYSTGSYLTNNISQISHYTRNGNTDYLIDHEYISYTNRGYIYEHRVNDGSNDLSHNRYSYDSVGRLVSSISITNNTEYAYEYDIYGNLTSVILYWLHNDLSRGGVLSTYGTYSYDSVFKSLLTTFNNKSITYDSCFNPLTYGTNISFSWGRGRMLYSYTDTSTSTTVNFRYNCQGLRYRKNINNETEVHEYYYNQNQLIVEQIYIGSILTYTQIYLYGHQGVYGLIRNGETYLFKKNIFNDVVAIYKLGALVCTYEYDDFGNLLSVKDPLGNNITSPLSVAHTNPFRYRSYYYDKETKLYYCQTRYYNPEWRRWLNFDDVSYLDGNTIGGVNLFAYCLDNPIMYSDESGHSVTAALLIGLGILTVTGIGLSVGGWLSNNEVMTNVGDLIISGAEIVGGTMLIMMGAGGELGGALLGTGIGSITNGIVNWLNGGSYHAGWVGGQLSGALSFIPYFGSAIGAFSGSLLTDLVDNQYDLTKLDWEKAVWSGTIAFGLSWFGSALYWGGGELSKATQFVLSYNSALLGIVSSIINVFWRGRKR